MENSEEEPTHQLTPFERLVLQRFDQIDARFDLMDERLAKVEPKNLETKPIWERALAETLDVSDRLRVLQEMFVENTTEMRLRHL